MRTKRFWSVVLLLMMAVSLVPKVTLAAAGDPPAHSKTLTVNNDGTYTIALSVTGDSEKEPNKANVIVVFDTSSSMNTATGNTEITYTPTDSTGGFYYQDDLYGLINEEYVPLERQTSGNWPNITYTFWYDGTEYTGQRYSRQSANQSRLQAAEEAVNALAKALLAYNGGDNPADTIQIALVDFANMAEIAQGPTTDYATFEAAVNSRNAGNNNRGTNWEAGLRTALNVNFNDPAGAKDKTYVIFVSDGNPTFYVNNNNTQGGTGQETNDNIATSYNQAVPAAEALVDAGYEFYTIGVYGNVTRMENLTTASGAPANHYYAAADTAALQAALASILNEIEMAGIGSVSMSDGTTSSVTTESGEIANLLTVDQSSYKYYRSGGSYSTTANGGLGETWSGAPTATFQNGAVKWDLSSEGVLEDDVTYTVTFDCWPSQTTLDIIADIKNDPSAYDELDPEIQKYITRNGDLRTNTSASLTYVDTRTGQSGSATYENPDPVETVAAKQLAVSKKWENELDGQEAKPITLKVTCDDEDKYTVDLSNDNDWTDNVYISIGILRTTGGTVEVLSPGHEFTFVEPKDLGYYWELDVPVVRPMLVNGTLTMLIKTDAKHQPNGAQTYEIDGKEYFVSDTGTAGLTAVNHRRSRLNITKDVVGEAADPDQKFEFKINVVDSKASEGSADDLNSDYWVWFSVWDGDFVDCVKSGAEKQMKEGSWTGYYYAPSGSDIVVELKKGDNLRFLNLPSDSTYTITEQNIPNYYAFTSSELTSGTDSTFSGGETTTGKIETVNEDYTVKITNTYELTNVEIEKTFSGITEDQIPDDFTITASF
nr:VWA domain-containing protein [Clostridia bacterium]